MASGRGVPGLARWRVEEAIRFVKQSCRLEDIRLLRYNRLRIFILVTVVPHRHRPRQTGQASPARRAHPPLGAAHLRLPEFR
jgi:hypothetical protein